MTCSLVRLINSLFIATGLSGVEGLYSFWTVRLLLPSTNMDGNPVNQDLVNFEENSTHNLRQFLSWCLGRSRTAGRQECEQDSNQKQGGYISQQVAVLRGHTQGLLRHDPGVDEA
jgi:hypothetical protein